MVCPMGAKMATKKGQAGGIARAASMAPEQRSEQASKAANARWSRRQREIDDAVHAALSEREFVHAESSRILARLAAVIRAGASDDVIAECLENEINHRAEPPQKPDKPLYVGGEYLIEASTVELVALIDGKWAVAQVGNNKPFVCGIEKLKARE